ncbi:MAG: hypothetical protein RTV31_16800 [Candidatus Thorarchaeota archaeon]
MRISKKRKQAYYNLLDALNQWMMLEYGKKQDINYHIEIDCYLDDGFFFIPNIEVYICKDIVTFDTPDILRHDELPNRSRL